MSNIGEGIIDPQFVSIVSQAESCLLETEMSSGSISSEPGQLTANVPSAPSCCELAARVSGAGRPGQECLLDVALLEEFSKFRAILDSVSHCWGSSSSVCFALLGVTLIFRPGCSGIHVVLFLCSNPGFCNCRCAVGWSLFQFCSGWFICIESFHFVGCWQEKLYSLSQLYPRCQQAVMTGDRLEAVSSVACIFTIQQSKCGTTEV